MLTGAPYVITWWPDDGSLSEASAAILANHSSRIRSFIHRQGVAVIVCPYLPWLGRNRRETRESGGNVSVCWTPLSALYVRSWSEQRCPSCEGFGCTFLPRWTGSVVGRLVTDPSSFRDGSVSLPLYTLADEISLSLLNNPLPTDVLELNPALINTIIYYNSKSRVLSFFNYVRPHEELQWFYR